MHTSIATIQNPEFVNLEPLDINPLMSACEIKVFYLGKNRNGSYIDKDTALKMSKTLRGAPIVGYFKKEKDDFRDHGESITIEDGEVVFNCLTKPYGFVSPDAKVWFQDFLDVDDFGNQTTRTYLMTTGYLWTEQFKECKKPLEEGRPHSMELDTDTLDGQWEYDVATDMEFFIINDAIFSKLCILGDDVEPCFEGSSVTTPAISKNFKLSDDFATQLYTMAKELKTYINQSEGGQVDMEKDIERLQNEIFELKETVSAKEAEIETLNSNYTELNDKFTTLTADNEQLTAEHDELVEKYTNCSNDLETANNNLSELQTQFEQLKEEKDNLDTYYTENERAKKQNLIDSFTVLSDEDKSEVLSNIDNYSYEDIEAKLSVLFTRHFKSNTSSTRFNLDTQSNSNEVDWVQSIVSKRNN